MAFKEISKSVFVSGQPLDARATLTSADLERTELYVGLTYYDLTEKKLKTITAINGDDTSVSSFATSDDLANVEGTPGKSAYELYRQNGGTLNLTDWLNSLKGSDGSIGKSAYQSYKDGGGELSESAWLSSLVGASGKSAYQSYLDTTTDNPKKTETQWLESLDGKDGLSAYDIYLAQGGTLTEDQWLESLHGKDASIYISSSTNNWVINGKDSGVSALGQKGADGEKGTSVKILGSKNSASELPVSGNTAGDGYIISGQLHVWDGDSWENVGSIQGPQGEKGEKGDTGANGKDGKDASTAYYHTAWTNSLAPSWTDFTVDNPDGNPFKYIGTYVDYTENDSSDKTKYKWVYVKGADGVDSSVKIGSNGNWFVNGVDTGVTAAGKDGIDGTDGVDGKDGKSVKILGSKNSQSELPSSNNTAGDGYIINGNLWVWDGDSWENVGQIQGPAGKDGSNGLTPYIQGGYWYIGTTNTGVKAQGTDGVTPVVSIGSNGNWFINSTDTGKTSKGDNGKSPYINATSGTWWEYDASQGQYTDTNIKAKGNDAHSPKVSENSTWEFWDDTQNKYVDSGKSVAGDDGSAPYIGTDGFWYEWDPAQKKYVATTVKAAGTNGIDGKDGKDASTAYYHTAWCNALTGTTGFTTSNPNGAAYNYIGTYVDYVKTDSENFSDYKWVYIKGATGPQGPVGPQGIPGNDGDDGVQGPAGKDGKTYYTHFAWCNALTGTTDFTTSNPNGTAFKYVGTRVDDTSTDSQTLSDYKWTYVKGSDGDKGEKGADGKYTHIAWATNVTFSGTTVTGVTGFSTTKSFGSQSSYAWMGTVVDTTEADSTKWQDYTWVYIKGEKGERGQDLVIDDYDNIEIDSNIFCINSDNFTLDVNGNITAKNANLSGTVNSTSGKIGGWVIGTQDIHSYDFKYHFYSDEGNGDYTVSKSEEMSRTEIQKEWDSEFEDEAGNRPVYEYTQKGISINPNQIRVVDVYDGGSNSPGGHGVWIDVDTFGITGYRSMSNMPSYSQDDDKSFRLSTSGSGFLASGNFSWNAAGDVSAAAGKLVWDKEGNIRAESFEVCDNVANINWSEQVKIESNQISIIQHEYEDYCYISAEDIIWKNTNQGVTDDIIGEISGSGESGYVKWVKDNNNYTQLSYTGVTIKRNGNVQTATWEDFFSLI